MLFLTRKYGESIIFKLPNGDVFRVEAMKPTEGTKDDVRLGLEGPANVVFLRDELLSEKEWAEVEEKLDSYFDAKKGGK